MLLYLSSLAVTHGEAWPRIVAMARTLGSDERCVRRSLASLERKGHLASRYVTNGEPLPSGQLVRSGVIRVFRPLVNGKARQPQSGGSGPGLCSQGRAVDPCPGRAVDPCPGRAVEPGPLNDLSICDRSILEEDESLGPPSRLEGRGRAGPAPEGGSAPPTLSPPTPPGSESERDDSAPPSAPPEGDAVTFGSTLAPPISRVEGVSPERESGSLQVRGAPPRTPRLLRPEATELVNLWRDRVFPELAGPLRTTRRLDAFAAMLTHGFTLADLRAVLEHVATDARREDGWHRKPSRRTVEFLMRSPEAVAAVLADARELSARAAAPKRAATPITPPVRPPTTAERAQNLEGVASLLAAMTPTKERST